MELFTVTYDAVVTYSLDIEAKDYDAARQIWKERSYPTFPKAVWQDIDPDSVNIEQQ